MTKIYGCKEAECEWFVWDNVEYKYLRLCNKRARCPLHELNKNAKAEPQDERHFILRYP